MGTGMEQGMGTGMLRTEHGDRAQRPGHGGTGCGDSGTGDSQDFLLPRDLLRSRLGQGRGLALCVTDFTRRSMISSEASSGELGTSSWAGEPWLGLESPVTAWEHEDAGINWALPGATPLCHPISDVLLPRPPRLRRAGTSVGELRMLFMLSWPTSACSCCAGLVDTMAGGNASVMPENFSVCNRTRSRHWGHSSESRDH